MVHFKRFVYINNDFHKVTLPIAVDFELQLGPYCGEGVGPSVYDLVGAVLHHGDGFSGHYTALVLGARGRWLLVNDEYSRLARPEDLRSPAYYMCFYRRRQVSGQVRLLGL